MSEILRIIVVTPWSTAFFAGNTLDYMALLLPAALGAALAFRAGLCNLGLDGQIYAGSLAAFVVLAHLAPDSLPAPLALCLAALAAMLTAALLASICAALRILCGANELITSFLLSAALTPLIDWCITAPLRDTAGNLLATTTLARERLLPRIMPPSALSASLFIALALPLAAHIVLNMTAMGYRFRLAGKSPDFARYGGITAERYWLPAFSLSGALGGLSGFFAAAGTYGALHLGWTSGLGWAAIACALIARSRTLALVPVALFYAYLKSGTDTALLISGAAFESPMLIQALALFAATLRVTRRKQRGIEQ